VENQTTETTTIPETKKTIDLVVYYEGLVVTLTEALKCIEVDAYFRGRRAQEKALKLGERIAAFRGIAMAIREKMVEHKGEKNGESREAPDAAADPAEREPGAPSDPSTR
jgi:hypothetical protein